MPVESCRVLVSKNVVAAFLGLVKMGLYAAYGGIEVV